MGEAKRENGGNIEEGRRRRKPGRLNRKKWGSWSEEKKSKGKGASDETYCNHLEVVNKGRSGGSPAGRGRGTEPKWSHKKMKMKDEGR